MATLAGHHSKVKVEHYRQGYPRLAAFLAIDPDFTLLKRFDNLHLRCLVELQDRLAELEVQLNQCDDSETIQLNLSSRRHDDNTTRRDLIREISHQLQIYVGDIIMHHSDETLLRYHQLNSLSQPRQRNLDSVRNWMDGNKPLVRSESSTYLGNEYINDFVCPRVIDHDQGALEALLETLLKAFPSIACKLRLSGVKTDDPNIVLFPPYLLARIINGCVVILVPLWLVVPAILLYKSPDGRIRTIIYSIFTTGTSIAMALVANPSKYNLMICVITYGAVLAAFLSATLPNNTT